MENIERWNLVLGGIMILVAALVFDREAALGVASGAILATLNFWGIRKLVASSLRSQGKRRMVLQLLLVAKMGILIVLVFLAIRYLPMHPLAFAIGMSVFLVSITVESLRVALGHEEPNGRA